MPTDDEIESYRLMSDLEFEAAMKRKSREAFAAWELSNPNWRTPDDN